ncbi:MAG: PAS domain-containing protein [Paracoccaceae bacterium]
MPISRTDGHGVIQAANGAFLRLSGHDWDSLLGAPHKIIRHPEMPSSVFHLFWQRLTAGRSVAAYIRNREASGRNYWALVLAVPLADGFVSVQIKPASALFSKIPSLYADLRRAELEDGISPESSRDALDAGIRALGFDGHEDFMAEALCGEAIARAELLGHPPERSVVHGREMANAIRAARSHAMRIAELFDEIRNVPTNIRILAAQLEEGSGPIGVISTNHTALSEEMLNGVDAFRHAAAGTYGAIGSGLFLFCAAAMLQESAAAYARDSGLPGSLDPAAEARILAETGRRCLTEAEEALLAITIEARRFAQVTEALKRHVAGLDVTRIMCKIENARFRTGTSSLTEIIDNLEEVQAQISTQLGEIEKASQSILNNARRASVQRVA